MNTFLQILCINVCVYSLFRRSHKLNIHKYLKTEIEIYRDRYIFSGFSWWAAQIENEFPFETFLLAILHFQKEFPRLSEIYLQWCLLQPVQGTNCGGEDTSWKVSELFVISLWCIHYSTGSPYGSKELGPERKTFPGAYPALVRTWE